jgi:hypothetical protein
MSLKASIQLLSLRGRKRWLEAFRYNCLPERLDQLDPLSQGKHLCCSKQSSIHPVILRQNERKTQAAERKRGAYPIC